MDLSTSERSRNVIVVLMGVTGCGKSVVGQELAGLLKWPMIEGDEFHSSENVQKMASGVPLTDSDRIPWLQCLANKCKNCFANGQSVILACSALTKRYRDILRADDIDDNRVHFVHLKGSKELITARLTARKDHFMNPKLLDSQFLTLESVSDICIEADILASPEHTANCILIELKKHLLKSA